MQSLRRSLTSSAAVKGALNAETGTYTGEICTRIGDAWTAGMRSARSPSSLSSGGVFVNTSALYTGACGPTRWSARDGRGGRRLGLASRGGGGARYVKCLRAYLHKDTGVRRERCEDGRPIHGQPGAHRLLASKHSSATSRGGSHWSNGACDDSAGTWTRGPAGGGGWVRVSLWGTP